LARERLASQARHQGGDVNDRRSVAEAAPRLPEPSEQLADRAAGSNDYRWREATPAMTCREERTDRTDRRRRCHQVRDPFARGEEDCCRRITGGKRRGSCGSRDPADSSGPNNHANIRAVRWRDPASQQQGEYAVAEVLDLIRAHTFVCVSDEATRGTAK
jgi:hypothetical protein